MSPNVMTKYKDRLFRYLFGTEETKENTLSLYNALNKSNYTNPDDLKFYTLEDVIYIYMKDDVAFILDDYLSIWEQQSTINPNMPLRGMQYTCQTYEKYIAEYQCSKYSSKKILLPTPKYMVFYNGTQEQPEYTEMRLSDSFLKPIDSGAYEWTAYCYNINKGKNKELFDRCKVLSDYAELISRIRENKNNDMSTKEAVDRAVAACIKDGILKGFLKKHQAEVNDMLLTEFDEELYTKTIREESYEEGVDKGVDIGIRNIIQNMLNNNVPPESIAKMTNYDIEFVKSVQDDK
jgi:hypothetical protein